MWKYCPLLEKHIIKGISKKPPLCFTESNFVFSFNFNHLPYFHILHSILSIAQGERGTTFHPFIFWTPLYPLLNGIPVPIKNLIRHNPEFIDQWLPSGPLVDLVIIGFFGQWLPSAPLVDIVDLVIIGFFCAASWSFNSQIVCPCISFTSIP